MNGISKLENLSDASRPTTLAHGLVQLLLTLALGIVLPLSIYFLFFPPIKEDIDTILRTSALAALAVTSAVVLLTQMIKYPGVSHAGTILPAFGSAFAVVLVALLIMREPYSNTVLILSFTLSVTVQFGIDALLKREGAIYYLVPGGRALSLAKIGNCRTHIWASPDQSLPRGAVVVADLHHDLGDEWERRIANAALEGVPIFHYKQVQEALTGRVQIEHLSENVLGSLIPSNSYHLLKRSFDLVAALAVCLPLIIMFPLVALAIKIDSPGPVFFRQERVGFGTRRFKVLKLRTMVVEQNDSGVQAAMTRADDDRITPLGRFLRRTRIDELPQVWNILCGDMSWIGPRPEALALSNWYAEQIPFYAYRHIVRPGITGWAQINQGHVTELDDINTKLEFDFFYIKHFSYWIDIIIAVRTISVMVNGFGAK